MHARRCITVLGDGVLLFGTIALGITLLGCTSRKSTQESVGISGPAVGEASNNAQYFDLACSLSNLTKLTIIDEDGEVVWQFSPTSAPWTMRFSLEKDRLVVTDLSTKEVLASISVEDSESPPLRLRAKHDGIPSHDYVTFTAEVLSNSSTGQVYIIKLGPK